MKRKYYLALHILLCAVVIVCTAAQTRSCMDVGPTSENAPITNCLERSTGKAQLVFSGVKLYYSDNLEGIWFSKSELKSYHFHDFDTPQPVTSLSDILNYNSIAYSYGTPASIKINIKSSNCSTLLPYNVGLSNVYPTAIGSVPQFSASYLKDLTLEIKTITPSSGGGLMWTKTLSAKQAYPTVGYPYLEVYSSTVTTRSSSGGVPAVSVYFPVDMGDIVLYNEDDLNWGGSGTVFDPSQLTIVPVIEWLMAENPEVLDEIVAYLYDNGIISTVDYDDYFDMTPTMSGPIYMDGEYSSSAVWLPPSVAIIEDGGLFAGVFEAAESMINSGKEVTIDEIENILNGEE